MTKGPEPVQEVVVGDRNEKRTGRRDPIVKIGAVEQGDIDDEVDDVARGADDAELRKLLPVVALAQRVPRAAAQARGDGCVLLLHRAGETSESAGRRVAPVAVEPRLGG